jgi:hypothetical protein
MDVPFYQIWLKAVTKPSVQTYEEIIADPNASASAAYIWLALVMLLGATISTLLQLIVQNMFGGGTAAYGSLFEQYGVDMPIPAVTGITTFICGIPLAVIFGLVGVTILVGITHGIARMLGGTGDFDKLLYAVAAYYSPVYLVNSLISPIPGLGKLLYALAADNSSILYIIDRYISPLLGLNCLSILVIIYLLVLNVIAVKANYQFDWGRAVAASVGVYVLLFILVFCCIMIFTVALGPAIGNTFTEILRQMGTQVP